VLIESEQPSLVVTTTADEDNGTSDPAFGSGTSLREAINYANSKSGADEITFSNSTANGAVNFHDGTARTITLGGSGLVISSNLTITGPGANLLNISGNDAVRVFHVTSGAHAAITGLTISE